MKRIALVVSASVITLALASAAPAAAAEHMIFVRTSLPSAKSVISATKKAIGTQTSVRLTLTSSGKSRTTEKVVEDEGKSSGLQSVTIGKAQAFVRFTKSAAYLSGNTAGLTTIFSLPSKDVKLVGTKWIYIKPGTTQYTDISGGGTIGPLANEILPSSTDKVAVTKSKVSGQEADVLTWGVTSSGTKVHIVLAIASTGKSLPLQLTATSGSDTAVTLFSHWNETISVTTPKSTIPITKIIG